MYLEILEQPCKKELIDGNEVLRTFGDCPERIFNGDESGFQLQPGTKPKGVVRRGAPPPQAAALPAGKDSATALPFGNVLGERRHIQFNVHCQRVH